MDEVRRFAEISEGSAASRKKLEKTAMVAESLKSVEVGEASTAAVFFSGRPFPVWEETTLQVGGSLLWRVVQELSGKDEHELTAAYRKYGDLGAVAAAVLPETESSHLDLTQVENYFRKIATVRGPAAKGALVRDLLRQVTPLEAKYIVKIMTGDLRIGLKESLVEEAIAKAYGSLVGGSLKDVQRANMLLGDIRETLRLAAAGRLAEARMRLFHPIGFMLASPAESAEDALSYFQDALVEDKYDGIRAQAHFSGDTVRFFSRTRDEITESFPELPKSLAGLPQDAILDGEIVAWSYLVGEKDEPGRALPFSALQQRLGRKKVSEKLMREVPVTYLAFDVIYADGELLIDRPLRQRSQLLGQLLTAESKPIHHGDTLRLRSGQAPTRRKPFDQGELALTRQLSEDKSASPTTDDRQPTTARIIRAPRFQPATPQ